MEKGGHCMLKNRLQRFDNQADLNRKIDHLFSQGFISKDSLERLAYEKRGVIRS